MRATGYPDEIRIGPWRLLPALNLLQGDGKEVRLEPRHVDLLVFLAERRGEVVGTDDILAGVWGGQIVGDHSIYQTIAKLRRALGDEAVNSTFIETVSKRGYRLIAEVAYPAGEPPRSSETPFDDEVRALRAPSRRFSRDRRVWAGAFVLVLALALGAARLLPSKPTASPFEGVRRVVVLPFASLSQVESDRLVAEGFSIELGNALGGSDGLQVLGPVTAKLISEPKLDPAEIGRRLRADVIASGSVRRSGDRLRISAALTDTATGYQIWSRIFERPDGDAFPIQTGIAEEIASALHRTLAAGNAPGADRTGARSSQAYERYLLGQYYRSIRTQTSLARAADFFRQTLEIDPDFADAKRDLATALLLLSFYGDLPLSQALRESEPLLADCLRNRSNDPELLGAIGLSHYLRGSYGLAEDYLSRAVAGGPSYVEGWMWLGLAQRQQGRLLDALRSFSQARSLEPLMAMAAINDANALSWTGDHKAAMNVLGDLIPTVGDHPLLFVVSSNIALETGDLVTAHKWARRGLAVDPDGAVARANMAMVLVYLDRNEAAEALLAGTGPKASSNRAAQIYLDRLALASPSLGENVGEQARESQYLDEPDVPELDWRLDNARKGIRSYFSGDYAAASERLAKSLDGRAYPIKRTDYDLFLCTSLADSYLRQGKGSESASWLARCDRDLTDANKHGWKTLALAYVQARAAMLHQDPAGALDRLAALARLGFGNRQLLEMDPVFAAIRGDARFRAIGAKIAASVERAWTEISSTGH